jgi:hypothetical protein
MAGDDIGDARIGTKAGDTSSEPTEVEMTHFKDLEEYEDDHLKAELKRREMSRTFRTCDYCHRETSTCDKTPCRYPRRAKRYSDKVEVVKGDFVIGRFTVTRKRLDGTTGDWHIVANEVESR